MKRAYGSEPILLDASPVTPALPPAKKRGLKKRPLFFWGIALLLIICGVGGYYGLKSDSRYRIPEVIVRRASFSLYYPAWLPSDMTVQPDSFDGTQQVVTFSVRDAQGVRLVFTEQPWPGKEAVTAFHEQQLAQKRSFKLDKGEVVVGRFEGSAFATVTLDNTWILIRAVTDIDTDQLEKIARQLRSER